MLVGRDAELAVLDALTTRARAGVGGVVLLTGEPGVGKTRLARAGAERAGETAVCWGACRESEGAPPLWPWTQVLRHLGGPGITAGAAEGRTAEGAAARYRLYEQVAGVLTQAAEGRPHLVVIDDLHRADEASLRLLAYLSETLWPAPVGMILTYRDTEVPPASLAAEAIASLARGPGRRRCELTGLSQASVAQWLSAAGLDGVDPAGLHARTGGNPLFISESIQLLTDGFRPDTPLRSVREVIRERLAPLPPGCREALEVASVLGRDFEYPPLAAALRISPAAAVAALDPAVNARLIGPVAERAGAYRFVHTLIRDAVEEQLAPSRRAGLHARAFTALRDTGWGQPADLAHHAVQGRPGVTDEVAAGAARDAAVLDIAARLGDQDLLFRAHQWLVPDRFHSGALREVAADVEQMAAIAGARRSPLQRWWMLIYRGLLVGFAGRNAEAESLAHEAAALGHRLGLPAADAYRIGQLGRIYWNGRTAATQLGRNYIVSVMCGPAARCEHRRNDDPPGRKHHDGPQDRDRAGPVRGVRPGRHRAYSRPAHRRRGLGVLPGQ